jgi:hypothetical protein
MYDNNRVYVASCQQEPEYRDVLTMSVNWIAAVLAAMTVAFTTVRKSYYCVEVMLTI